MVLRRGPCLLTLRRIQAFENRLPRKQENDLVRSKINFLVGPQEPVLSTAKRRKLAWFGHVTRHDSLSRIILQGTLKGG